VVVIHRGPPPVIGKAERYWKRADYRAQQRADRRERRAQVWAHRRQVTAHYWAELKAAGAELLDTATDLAGQLHEQYRQASCRRSETARRRPRPSGSRRNRSTRNQPDRTGTTPPPTATTTRMAVSPMRTDRMSTAGPLQPLSLLLRYADRITVRAGGRGPIGDLTVERVGRWRRCYRALRELPRGQRRQR
jgi:hypothetical protein